MRFDEASARYAEFGQFYIGYIMPAADALKHLRLLP
jgi:chlorite dismutase